MDIVVLPSSKAARQNNEVLRQSLDKHWNRICKQIRERIEKNPNGRNHH